MLDRYLTDGFAVVDIAELDTNGLIDWIMNNWTDGQILPVKSRAVNFLQF